jgi:hypothetical protein
VTPAASLLEEVINTVRNATFGSAGTVVTRYKLFQECPPKCPMCGGEMSW